MSSPDPLFLSGQTARFKGGRNYVHGTDLIAYLDDWASVNLKGHLSKIEFRRPLEHLGAMLTGPSSDIWDIDKTTAVGRFESSDGGLHFALFATPLRIQRSDIFDEKKLLDATISDPDGKAVLEWTSGATVTEHASSAMKALCGAMLPHHQRWWFARCKLYRTLPASFQRVELEVKRVMAKTLVTAEIRFDGISSGEMVFAGASE